MPFVNLSWSYHGASIILSAFLFSFTFLSLCVLFWFGGGARTVYLRNPQKPSLTEELMESGVRRSRKTTLEYVVKLKGLSLFIEMDGVINRRVEVSIECGGAANGFHNSSF